MGGSSSQETPAQDLRVRSILAFVVRFMVLMGLGLFIWWQAMDAYVYGVGWVAQWPLRALGEPIEKVELYGKSQQKDEGDPHIGIVYRLESGREQGLADLQRFYMSLPTFLALVLATSPMTWKRRIVALGAGAAILLGIHIAYLVVMFYGRDFIMAHWEDAVRMQMTAFTTAPFLLWALLAYGGRIRQILGRTSPAS